MTFLLALLSPFATLWGWFQKLDLATKVAAILSVAVFVLAALYGNSRDDNIALQKRLSEAEAGYKEKTETLDRQTEAIKALSLAQQEQQKVYEASLQKAKKEASKQLAKAGRISKVKPTGDDCKDVALLFNADKKAGRND